ncbi:MAG: hypothetical protein IJG13_15440 [Kiritimatiellae bacterium]|nr:hypothetical protein [Kiritimatiellia bacterium]
MRAKCVMSFAAAVLAANVWAEAGNWKVPSWSPVLTAPDAVKKVIDGKCPGHSQGMCATSNALFFSFHNQVVKTDWKGRFLKRVEAVPHGGDICHWKGRVYVGAWEPPAKKGAKGCTAIRVYDADTLEPVKERRMPEWQNAADGITCLDGVIILAMGMEDWNSPVGNRNYFGKFDAETLEPIGKPFVVDHGEEASCGAQNLATDGKFIYASYYTRDEAARTPNFIVFDRDFKVVGKHLFGWTHGMDVVPGGLDGSVRLTCCITLNNNWDVKSLVVPQVVVQFGDLKDGKLTDITKYIGYNKPMKR